ncbi:MAG: DnaB-like helicase C-terminal domain-containing protein, partial [Pseudomonadota bacterium]
ESGAIEQDADVVLFVFREEYYVKNAEPRRTPEEIASDIKSEEYLRWEEKMNKVKGTADVIVAKQRHGPTGTVSLGFQAEYTRFSDLADSSYLQYSHE